MSSLQVVIGSGPDALRAAATLAHLGHDVHLVQQSETVSGLNHTDLPIGTGLIHVDSEHRQATEAVLGPLVEGPDTSLSIVLENCIESIPLGLSSLRRVLPGSVFRGVSKSLLRARGRNLMAEIIGGGMEERSHKDWVIRRMGEPAWHHLYRSYAERRWGLPSQNLASSVARIYHGRTEARPVQVVGGSYGQALETAESCLRRPGCTITTGQSVERLELADGRVSKVHLGDGTQVDIGDRLWVCSAPSEVSGWLGDEIPGGVRVHARKCMQLPVLRVALRGETRDLPLELHVLDERASFWRVTSPYGIENTAVFHITAGPNSALPDDDEELARRIAREASQVGIEGFREEGARVERLPAWQPVWGPVAHAFIRSVLLHWDGLGIIGVGRGGTMAALNPGEEIGMVLRLCADPDQLEIHRRWAYPPVEELDLNSRLSHFVGH